MNKTRVSRSEGVIEAILEGLEEGGTLTSICEAPGMPSIRAVQKWQRNDDELDEKVLRAWIRGLRIRHDQNADRQADILSHPDKYDPKTINAIATIMRDVNHNLMGMLTRLDHRFSDKRQVDNLGNQPMIIRWADEKNCATEDAVMQIR